MKSKRERETAGSPNGAWKSHLAVFGTYIIRASLDGASRKQHGAVPKRLTFLLSRKTQRGVVTSAARGRGEGREGEGEGGEFLFLLLRCARVNTVRVLGECGRACGVQCHACVRM